MQVTIGDLDYYYAKNKRNCYNVDAMKISSFHKQCGDTVNFVCNEDDIRRPYDIYYIIKEKSSTPNPPLDFYTNSAVRGWGAANRARITGKMDAVMLGCRPDYLLYPEKNTRQERAEYIRLFDNTAHLLPIKQDYSNSFKNKDVIVVDTYMGESSKKSILQALSMLDEVKNVSFSEQIRLDLILNDEDIKNKFLELKLSNRSKLVFAPIDFAQVDAAIEFVLAIRTKFCNVSLNGIVVRYNAEKHWSDYLAAYRDFNDMKRAVIKGRKAGVRVIAAPLARRLDTPYFHLFEELHKGSSREEIVSWYEYISRVHYNCKINDPSTWDDVYRELIRQTYIDKEFFLTKGKDSACSENEIPGELLDKEFKYGI